MFDMGAVLKDLRNSKGFTQDQVARKLNVSVVTIVRWENNYRTPTIDHVTELALLYNVPINTIVGVKRENEVMIDQLTSAQKQLMHDIVAELKEHKKHASLTNNQKRILCDLLDAFLEEK